MAEKNIYRAYNFILDLGGGIVGYFTKVSGLSIDIGTIPYREGGAGPAVRQLVGRVSYGEVECKWGLSESNEMMEWVDKAARGEADRKNLSIILRDTDGVTEITRWNLENAWPCKWRGAELDAMSNDIAIETLCLVHEGLTRA